MPRVIGWVLPPPSSVVAKMKSDHAHKNANRETVTIALRLMGSTTDRKVRQLLAPSILAASVSSLGIPDMNAVRIRTPKGTAIVESAITRPHQVLMIPMLR